MVFLTKLRVWLVKVSDTLSKWKRTQRLTIVQIGGMDKSNNCADGKSFETLFTLPTVSLPTH